jgi:hypothetical protein
MYQSSRWHLDIVSPEDSGEHAVGEQALGVCLAVPGRAVCCFSTAQQPLWSHSRATPCCGIHQLMMHVQQHVFCVFVFCCTPASAIVCLVCLLFVVWQCASTFIWMSFAVTRGYYNSYTGIRVPPVVTNRCMHHALFMHVCDSWAGRAYRSIFPAAVRLVRQCAAESGPSNMHLCPQHSS